MYNDYYINAMVKIWRLKRLGIKTIDNYKGHLERYLNHFKTMPEQITHNQQMDYFLNLKSPTHRNQAIAVIRQMHLHILNKPIEWTSLPYAKKDKSLPEYFTQEEITTLIAAIQNPKQKCFAAIQYLCGLRVSEVLNIKMTDISTKTMLLRINGKGRKQREINLPNAVIPFIKDYWTWVSPKPKQFLFEGQYGGRYSSRSMQLVIGRAKQKAGLGHKKCSTHGLRHSAATHRLNDLGWSTRHVQVFLGHSNIKTTERYTHVSANDMKKLNQPMLHAH